MNEIADFFSKLLDTTDWPPRWHCGRWTSFHGWLYIVSDLLVWSAYFTIPLIIVRYISRKHDSRFVRLYFLFAAFILACGTTHLLDATSFWIPTYRLNALVRLITGIISWITVYYLLRILPAAFSLRSAAELEKEIEQRKHAEEQVRILNAELEQRVAYQTAQVVAMESRCRAVIENSTEAICLMDTSYQPVYLNASARKMLWMENWMELVHADDFARLQPMLYTMITNQGSMVQTTFRLRTAQNDYIWIEGSVSNMLQDKAIKSIVFNLHDVTEVLQNERQNALYESIVNSSDDAIISKTTDGIITSWNNGAEITFGYSAEEMIGQPIATIIPPERMEEELEIMEKVKAGEYVRHYETERVTRTGKRVAISLTVSPLMDAAGRIFGASKIARDITEEKENQEKVARSERIYRAIATHLPRSIITILDKDRRFLLAEGQGLALLGYNKKDIEGKLEKDALRADAYAEVAHLRGKAFEGESSSREMKFGNLHLLICFVPLPDENGDIYAVMTISTDISDVKEAEQQVKGLAESLERKVTERTQQLEYANKELEAFSYSVSHDLRSPLRIINGYADIVLSDHGKVLDPDCRRMIEAILLNTQQMGRLIDELLNLSRLGRKELHITATDMNSIAQQAIREQSLHYEHIACIDITDLEPAFCDSLLVRHVWNNLVSNALKYSSKVPNPTIEIRSLKKDKEVVYSVRDNGVGFDMKYSDRLFGVFQRLHKRTEFEGTGVGLALTQRIVSRHGGRIWVDAKEDEGATFYFSLPNENKLDGAERH